MDKILRVVLLLLLIGASFLAGWITFRTVDEAAEEQARGLRDILLPQPTPTIYPSAATIIESVQRLSRLETTSYHIEKVITAESGQGPLGFLLGDRLLLIAYGEVIAGIDLAKVGTEDVVVTDSGTLYLQLPPAEIFVATLNNERTSVYDRRTGVIGLNPQLETEARREAERLILEAAIEDGIEAEAEASAKEFLRSFLLALGFEEIIFPEEMPTPTPVLTPTPEPSAFCPGYRSPGIWLSGI